MPETTGVHHLYAQLQESPGDSQPSNNIATLDVTVFRDGDINGDGQVNRADLDLLLTNVGKRAEGSSCGLLCDVDGDGRISVLDARKLILMCNTAGCASQ